jgi:hypothetical protein
MKSDPNDFETLRKLMALKRHEQPPPGYFNRLPGKIADRIERGDGKLGFWEKWITEFTFRPAFAYGVALAAFGALTVSVIYSVKPPSRESAYAPSKDGWRIGAPDGVLAGRSDPSEPLHVANWMGNTNPSAVSPVLPSLFRSGPQTPVLHASFASPP